MKAMRATGWKLWAHGMEKYISSKKAIMKIDAKLIRKKWMNVEFMHWAFHIVSKISFDRRTLIPKLMEAGSNIMAMLTPSDVSWSATVLLNNDKYWGVCHDEKTRIKCELAGDMEANKDSRSGDKGTPLKSNKGSPLKSPVQNAPSSRKTGKISTPSESVEESPPESPAKGTRLRKRKGAPKTPPAQARATRASNAKKKTGDPPKSATKRTASGSPKNAKKKVSAESPGSAKKESPKKQGGEKKEGEGTGTEIILGRDLASKMSRWTKVKKNLVNGDGWDEEGKLFYEKVRQALKEIPVSEWKEVWDEFWFVEREKYLSGNNRRKKPRKMEVEVVNRPDEDGMRLMFSEDEEEFMEEDVGVGEPGVAELA